MITMDMIGKVRRMRMRDKLSISEIAKTTRLSRNTIKKWLKEPGDVEPKYRRSSPPGKLTAYMPTLEQCLKTDSHRPKHACRNGKGLLKRNQTQCYRGGYSRVTYFIRAWPTQVSKDSSRCQNLSPFFVGQPNCQMVVPVRFPSLT